MSIHYYDWPGNYKLVTISSGRTLLVDQDVDMSTFAQRLYHEWGYLPSISAVILVSEEFFEEWKTIYGAKGLFMASSDAGSAL